MERLTLLAEFDAEPDRPEMVVGVASEMKPLAERRPERDRGDCQEDENHEPPRLHGAIVAA